MGTDAVDCAAVRILVVHDQNSTSDGLGGASAEGDRSVVLRYTDCASRKVSFGIYDAALLQPPPIELSPNIPVDFVNRRGDLGGFGGIGRGDAQSVHHPRLDIRVGQTGHERTLDLAITPGQPIGYRSTKDEAGNECGSTH